MTNQQIREEFDNWYTNKFGKEASDLTDGHTYMLYDAFRAGVSAEYHNHNTPVIRTPIQVRQTQESARQIGREITHELRRSLGNNTLTTEEVLAAARAKDGCHQ